MIEVAFGARLAAASAAAMMGLPAMAADPQDNIIDPRVYRGVDALIDDVAEGRVPEALARLGGVEYPPRGKAHRATPATLVDTIEGCEPVRRRYARQSGFPLAIVDWHCGTDRFVTFLRPSRKGEAGEVVAIDFNLSPRPLLKDQDISRGKAIDG